MTKIERMELAKENGTVVFEGKKYWLKQQAHVDNYGTDGGVRYYASAVDRFGHDVMIAWNTTVAWDELGRGLSLIEKINDAENNGEDCLSEKHDLEQIIENYGDPETYHFDESDACDWNNPVDVEIY
jgi:hypothetical protein